MPYWKKIRTTLLILIFFLNLSIILALWWNGSSSLILSGENANLLIAVGRVAGLLTMYLILVQVLLVSRVRFIEQIYGFDKLNNLHRKLGYYIIGGAVLHPILLTAGYSQLAGTSFWSQFLSFFQTWEAVWMAVVGLVLMLVIVGISLAIIRQKLRYETWYFSHLGIYMALALIFQHQIKFADVSRGRSLIYWLALNFTVAGLLVLYRVLRPLYRLYQHRFYVEKIVEESPGVQSVYLKGRNIKDYYFEAGQFANLTFFKKGFWFSHPFSFSVAPGKDYLRFTIKGSGDFTNTISNIPAGTKVLVEGPLGMFTERSAITNKFLFIAGGIGITPIRALSEFLAQNSADIVMLYSARKDQDLVFKQELASFVHQLHLFTTEGPIPAHGFPQISIEAIKQMVPDYSQRDIYICGPKGMILALREKLLNAGVPTGQIHFELFAY